MRRMIPQTLIEQIKALLAGSENRPLTATVSGEEICDIQVLQNNQQGCLVQGNITMALNTACTLTLKGIVAADFRDSSKLITMNNVEPTAACRPFSGEAIGTNDMEFILSAGAVRTITFIYSCSATSITAE